MYLVLIKVRSFCSKSSWLFLALSLGNPSIFVLSNIHWVPVWSRYLVVSPGNAVANPYGPYGTMSKSDQWNILLCIKIKERRFNFSHFSTDTPEKIGTDHWYYNYYVRCTVSVFKKKCVEFEIEI